MSFPPTETFPPNTVASMGLANRNAAAPPDAGAAMATAKIAVTPARISIRHCLVSFHTSSA